MIIIRDESKIIDILCSLVGCTIEQLGDDEFINSKLSDDWKVYTHAKFHTIDYNKMLIHLKEFNNGILFDDTKISENPEYYATIPTVKDLIEYLKNTLFNIQ